MSSPGRCVSAHLRRNATLITHDERREDPTRAHGIAHVGWESASFPEAAIPHHGLL